MTLLFVVMCRRDTDDRLMRVFLDRYGLNLMAVPRAGVEPGHVYVEVDGRVMPPASLVDLLDSPTSMPAVSRPQPMAGVAGTWSSSHHLDLGLVLLGRFLAAVHPAAALIEEIGAAYRAADTSRVQFAFDEPTLSSLDPGKLGKALRESTFDARHGLIAEGNRYFVVVGAARSRCLRLASENRRSQRVEANIAAVVGGEVTAGLSIETDETGVTSYAGTDPVVFGLQLVEIARDPTEDKFHFSTPADPVRVRSIDTGETVESDVVFLGDPWTGDAFVELPGSA